MYLNCIDFLVYYQYQNSLTLVFFFRRYNYTTPKSFLEAIALYKRLMNLKFSELRAKTLRLENGLKKLKDTSEKVKT